MSIQTKTYRDEHAIEHRDDIMPEGFEIVETYVPHSTPWDCYGNGQCQEWRNVMRAANIECYTLQYRSRNCAARGSGPNGRLRFGDDMMPSTYKLAVRIDDMPRATLALEQHQTAIDAWLHDGADMPTACR